MRYIIIGAAALASFLDGPVMAARPEVEQGLGFLVGEWTIAGMEDRYRDSCAWFEDHAFVVCNTMDGRHGKPQHHVAVLGWSEAAKTYTYLSYAQDGSSRSESCFANGLKGVTCLGEYQRADGFNQVRTHIWPLPTGLGLRQEKSVNGGAWSDVGQVRYIRTK